MPDRDEDELLTMRAPKPERIAVINRSTRKAAWDALLEHLAAGRLDEYDRVIIQHDEAPIAHITLDTPYPYA